MADQSPNILNPDMVADIHDLTDKLHKAIFHLMKQTDDTRVMIAAIATNYCLFCAISGLSQEEFKQLTMLTWEKEVLFLKQRGIRRG